MHYISLVLFISIKSFAVESLVIKHSKHFNLDKQLVLSIIKVESNFNNDAVSHTNDYGLMQINKNTAKIFGFSIPRIKKDKDYAIYCGTFYLSYLRYKYSHKDKYWWARYHSNTPTFKQKYIRRILNVYETKGIEATPRRYYSNKRVDESQWLGSLLTWRPRTIAMAN